MYGQYKLQLYSVSSIKVGGMVPHLFLSNFYDGQLDVHVQRRRVLIRHPHLPTYPKFAAVPLVPAQMPHAREFLDYLSAVRNNRIAYPPLQNQTPRYDAIVQAMVQLGRAGADAYRVLVAKHNAKAARPGAFTDDMRSKAAATRMVQLFREHEQVAADVVELAQGLNQRRNPRNHRPVPPRLAQLGGAVNALLAAAEQLRRELLVLRDNDPVLAVLPLPVPATRRDRGKGLTKDGRPRLRKMRVHWLSPEARRRLAESKRERLRALKAADLLATRGARARGSQG